MNMLNIIKNNRAEQGLNYALFEQWLDKNMCKLVPNDAVTICFRLYENKDKQWRIVLSGVDANEAEDRNWERNVIFSNQETPLVWVEDVDWTQVNSETEDVLNRYLQQGQFCHKIKQYKGVSLGINRENLDYCLISQLF